MCGITGFWSPQLSLAAREGAIAGMSDCLAHRGPDADGQWTPPEIPLALGHRRLSILDLSAAGAQPMASPSGRFMISFNGEIYNFRELRERLHALGFSFRGSSDTEVLLAGFEAWGVTKTLQEAVGMFALAIWDSREQELSLARDRIGEKPLYYGACGTSLLFGSELRSLRRHPHWEGAIDRGAVTLLMRYGFIPAPYSVHAGVGKVVPGTILRFRPHQSFMPTVTTYWSATDETRRAIAAPDRRSDAELVEEFDVLLRRAVRQQMVADVPLGVFLSGGLDSTAVTAAMQAQSDVPVRTFSIGFSDPRFDEAGHARAVAAHLGTTHTEHYVTATEAIAVVDQLPTLYDEPFADWSQIPTYLVSKLARSEVTVALTGDGGDELFGGYDRYRRLDSVWRKLSIAPPSIRRTMARGADVLARRGGHDAPSALQHRARKLARLLRCERREDLYHELLSSWSEPGLMLHNPRLPGTSVTQAENQISDASFPAQMMLLDLLFYMEGDLLVKTDRAAMAVSLETRTPFLDHRIAEFAFALPMRAKIRDGESKWILRQVLDRYVPRALIERPKMGFGAPMAEWLRGPLREWAQARLEPAHLNRDGMFDAVEVGRAWQEHLRGKFDNSATLWPILMYDAWAEGVAEQTERAAPQLVHRAG